MGCIAIIASDRRPRCTSVRVAVALFYPSLRTKPRWGYPPGPQAGGDPAAGADRAASPPLDPAAIADVAPEPEPGRVLSGNDPPGPQAVRLVLEKSPQTVE